MQINMYGVLIYFMLVLITSIFGENKTEIESYRKNLLLHIFNHIPYKLLNNPQPKVESSTVQYYLYSQKYPHNSIVINDKVSIVNPKWPVKFLVHGWTEHYFVEWCKNLTAAYLKSGKYNVIVTDWSKKGDADYMSASMSVKAVGNLMGDYIAEKLLKEKKIPLKNIHIISHSLGAHVAGLTGQRVYKLVGKKVARITALDPAAPIFDLFPMGDDDRLSSDDANFVDIVHTDSGMLGFQKSIGTVDFYPNGGKAIQPGCSLLKPDVRYEDLFCSHARSHKFFLSSVLGKNMLAVPCDSWDKYVAGQCDNNKSIQFGENVPHNISGTYFLRTPEEPLAG